MIGWLLLLASEVGFSERQPLPVLLLSPTKAGARVPSSALLAAAASALEAATDYRAHPLEPAAFEECAARLDCLGATASRLGLPEVLILSRLTQPQAADLLSVAFLAQGTVGGPRRGRVEDQAGARALVEAFLAGEAAAVLEQRGHHRPLGQLVVEAPAGAWLFLEEASLGSWRSGGTLALRPGWRSLRVEAPGCGPVTVRLEILPGQEQRWRAECRPVPGDSGVAPAFRWGGLGLAALGGAMATYAIVRADSDALSLCLHRAGDAACQGVGDRHLRPGFTPDEAGSFTAGANPAGPALAPLGVALALAGLASFGGSYAFQAGEDGLGWVSLLGGLAVAGASYGLMVGLEGRSAFSVTDR